MSKVKTIDQQQKQLIHRNPNISKRIKNTNRTTQKATFNFIDSGTEEHEFIPIQPKSRRTIDTKIGKKRKATFKFIDHEVYE